MIRLSTRKIRTRRRHIRRITMTRIRRAAIRRILLNRRRIRRILRILIIINGKRNTTHATQKKSRRNKIRPNKNIVVYLLGNQLHFGSSCKRDY